MKRILFPALMLFCTASIAQYPDAGGDPQLEQSLEDQAARSDQPPEDDSYWQSLEWLRKHPLNLNTAGAGDLEELGILAMAQIQAFLEYRKLLGDLISIHELQAVPGWDLETIRRLLPFVQLQAESIGSGQFRHRWTKGDQSMLLRSTRIVEKSRAYQAAADTGSSRYAGGPERIFFRYTYAYRQLLHYGLLGEKDPGEQFFRGSQPQGFDFYSFHFFLSNLGHLKALALGDFTVSLGQGLIQWQSLAFSKGSDVMGIRRQSPTLRPYTASGEYNFQRGIGISLQEKNWEGTLFISRRQLDARLRADTSLSGGESGSFETSGLHRTLSEIQGKGRTRQVTEGARLAYSGKNFRLGLNGISYQFSHAIQREMLPYNIYGMRGKSWWNASLDFSAAYNNVYVFGEFAIDRHFNKAGILGAVISLGRQAGLSVLYRDLGKAYQSMNGNAFTENTQPTNEQGFYTGLTLQAARGLTMDFFLDVFRFPWLKYRVDCPAYGREFLVQATYKPTREWTIFSRFRNEGKMGNASAQDQSGRPVLLLPRLDWRTESIIGIGKEVRIRSRIEFLWLRQAGGATDPGFLTLSEIYFHPRRMAISGNLCVQYFETGSYASRVYVYESDVLYSLSMPMYYNSGLHYYINLQARISELLRKGRKPRPGVVFWLRWGQTVYRNQDKIGTGPDEIPGNKKSEWKMQVMVNW